MAGDNRGVAKDAEKREGLGAEYRTHREVNAIGNSQVFFRSCSLSPRLRGEIGLVAIPAFLALL